MLSHNDSDVFEIQFACQRLGAIFLPLNWRLAVPELEFICNDATPKVLIHGVEFAGEAADVTRLANVPCTVDINNGGESGYETGIATVTGDLPTRTNQLSDIWTIMYTSGTTGRPKGAIITYEMVLYNSVHSTMLVELTQRSKNLVFLPTFHTGGLNVFGNPIFHTGGCNVIMRAFDPEAFLALLTDKELYLTHAAGRADQLLDAGRSAGLC